MGTNTVDITGLAPRPKRADARRNYEKLLAAARDAFAEQGTAATLEDIAARAGVGIGTLYRHFPSRPDLLEAVYLDEVQAICAAAAEYTELPPWEALSRWLREFVAFAATKRVIAEEMLTYLDREPELFKSCVQAVYGAGEPLLRRAQEAGEARADTDIADVTKMIAGIAAIRASDPGQIDRIVSVALDGLRPPR